MAILDIYEIFKTYIKYYMALWMYHSHPHHLQHSPVVTACALFLFLQELILINTLSCLVPSNYGTPHLTHWLNWTI